MSIVYSQRPQRSNAENYKGCHSSFAHCRKQCTAPCVSMEMKPLSKDDPLYTHSSPLLQRAQYQGLTDMKPVSTPPLSSRESTGIKHKKTANSLTSRRQRHARDKVSTVPNLLFKFSACSKNCKAHKQNTTKKCDSTF